VEVHLPDRAKNLKGRQLVEEYLDSEISDFEAYFSQEKVGGTPLMPFERELLRAYLYYKATGGV
jgi:hypothetical protein